MKRKKYFSIFVIFTLLWSMFASIIPVQAASATVGFSGNQNVEVDTQITVKLNVSNVSGTDGGIVSLGGYIVFDQQYLQYVSSSSNGAPYPFQLNTTNYKIAGVDTMMQNGIQGAGPVTVLTIVFKTLKEGKTTVTMNDLRVSDMSNKFSANLNPIEITIGPKKTPPPSTPTPTPKSGDANLKSLSVDGYTLSPNFSANTTSYVVKVPTGTTSVKLNAAANHNKATVAGTGTINLTGDNTTASITVTAENGTRKTYTVRIEREKKVDPVKSNDATLKSLGASGYELSPSFDPNKTTYTVKVPSDATTIKLEGATNDGKATVTGLGNIALTGDNTTANITVTAEDGSKKTYTVNIEKEKKQEEPKKDSDATLKSLSISGYTLKPSFKSNINTYSINVKNGITGLDVSAIPNSEKAKVTISGNKGWKEGINTVTITVTAEDGSVNTYTINVTREASKKNPETPAKSSDNYLESLIINSSHEMKPPFQKNTSNYNITVPYEVDKLDLSYIKHDKAKVKITGNENFKVGEVNTVQIEVTAEDGSIRVYTLNVTRSTQESKNDLKELTVVGETISPSFDPDVLEYTTKVAGNVDKLDIRAIAKDKDAKVEIIGNENLKEGKNTILIKVTDKNGFTKYYTLNVEKEAKNNTILGLSPLQFGIISGIIGLLLLLLLLLLFKRRKDKEEPQEVVVQPAPTPPVTPIIEVKPEFNFGSKNSSDDDVVHGNFNQNSTITGTDALPEPKKIEAIEARYEEAEESMPYDPYDETVTKREIIDAIKEATKTKDPAKLKMLLEQDALNQKKKEIRKREEELRRKMRD